MRFAHTFAAILCLSGSAFPQAAFEVASIRPVDTSNGVMEAGFKVYPGGRLVIHALPLKAIVMAAYDVGYWQLSGGEAWMEKDIYDIEAKPAAQSGEYSLRHSRFAIGDERVRQVLQTLLADRFQLQVTRETRTGAIYLLEKGNAPTETHEIYDRPAGPGNSRLFWRDRVCWRSFLCVRHFYAATGKVCQLHCFAQACD